jgi:putative tricarboxylic transport membrane protein
MAAGVAAFGIFLMVKTAAIPVNPGYARVGPSVFPWIISTILFLIGLVLIFEAWTGRWDSGATEDEEIGAFSPPAFLWLIVGFGLYLATIAWAGFPIASALLFAPAARAFGSRRPALDLAIGLVLGILVYFGFNRGLGLSLPAGILGGLL